MISLFVSNRHDFSPTLSNLIVCADGRRAHESVMRERRKKSRNQLKRMLVSSGSKPGHDYPTLVKYILHLVLCQKG